jgi:hypothetical protein
MGGCNHDHSAERRVYELPHKEKVKEITDYKEQGAVLRFDPLPYLSLSISV